MKPARVNIPSRPIVFALALLALGGCARRQLTVTSEPSGALVYLNDREAGRTPFTTDLGWYGKYDVVVRKEGYETISSRKAINAPWWGYPPFDLFAEMNPARPTDRRSLNFTLTRRPEAVDTNALVARGIEMKRSLPTTQPAGQPFGQ